MTRPTLTDPEWIALLDFRDRNGRNWKEALSTAWCNGRDYYEPHGTELHALRNNYGPTWLYSLKPADLDRARRLFTLTPSTGR